MQSTGTPTLARVLLAAALLHDLDRAREDMRDGASPVLALFDLDGFKLYNDAFGHPAGDALLERLGHRLAEAMRGHGTAYRMGGDEFCVLVSQPGEHAAELVASAAEALSQERGDELLPRDVPVLGVGCLLVVEDAPDTLEELLADDAGSSANMKLTTSSTAGHLAMPHTATPVEPTPITLPTSLASPPVSTTGDRGDGEHHDENEPHRDPQRDGLPDRPALLDVADRVGARTSMPAPRAERGHRPGRL